MLEDELWMRQREKQSPNRQSKFLKTELRKLSFQFLNFEFSSVRFVEIYIRHFCRVPHTPNKIYTVTGWRHLNWIIYYANKTYYAAEILKQL